MSFDETVLSQRELYTVVTSKAAKRRKGALVAMVKGVDSEKVNDSLRQIPYSKGHKVKEITLHMTASMEEGCRNKFS